MLTNVLTVQTLVTSMPTATTPWDPTTARASRHIMGMEKSAKVSVSTTVWLKGLGHATLGNFVNYEL